MTKNIFKLFEYILFAIFTAIISPIFLVFLIVHPLWEKWFKKMGG